MKLNKRSLFQEGRRHQDSKAKFLEMIVETGRKCVKVEKTENSQPLTYISSTNEHQSIISSSHFFAGTEISALMTACQVFSIGGKEVS